MCKYRDLIFVILVMAVALNAKTFSSFEEAEKAFMLYGDKDAQAYVLDAGVKGNPKGQAYLAYMYLYGANNFPKDENKGVDLLKQSADYGVVSSQITIGDMYRDGMKFSRDYAKAIDYYQMASEQNHEKALRNLANMFELGLGIDKNLKVAYVLNTMSSRAPHPSLNAINSSKRLAAMLDPQQMAEANVLLSDREQFWAFLNKLKNAR